MKTQNTSGFVAITGIIISIGRLALGAVENLPDDVILIVMALVNYVALGFVLLFLFNDVNRICMEKVQNSGLATKEKSKAKIVNIIPSMILLAVYLGAGICYITFLKSNDLNDAMSIFALTLSIASNGLVKAFSPAYYKVLIKVATHKNKSKGA